MDVRTNNQLFLIGLASLSMGCSVGADNGGTIGPTPVPGTSGGSNTSGGNTTDPATGGPSSATSTTGNTTTGPMTTSMGPEPGSDTSSSGYGYDETSYATTSGNYGDEICAVYGMLIAQCYNDPGLEAEAADYCLGQLASFEAQGALQCASAFEDYMACLGSLTCVEYMAPVPCPAEDQALEALNCPL